jgi:hypothetical protein
VAHLIYGCHAACTEFAEHLIFTTEDGPGTDLVGIFGERNLVTWTGLVVVGIGVPAVWAEFHGCLRINEEFSRTGRLAGLKRIASIAELIRYASAAHVCKDFGWRGADGASGIYRPALGRSLVVSLVVESLGEALFSEGVGGILIEDGRVFLDCLVVVAVASILVGTGDEEVDLGRTKGDG